MLFLQEVWRFLQAHKLLCKTTGAMPSAQGIISSTRRLGQIAEGKLHPPFAP